MKTPSKPTKNMLSQDLDFGEEYLILEISSLLPEHKLVWLLNKELKTDFRRVSDLPAYEKEKTEPVFFPLFLWAPYETVSYFLFSNNINESLFPTTFIVIQGEETPKHIDAFIENIETLRDQISFIEKINLFEKFSEKGKRISPKRRAFLDRLYLLLADLDMHSTTLKQEQKLHSRKKNDSEITDIQ